MVNNIEKPGDIMLNLIIIEDEQIMREGLEEYINQSQLGFKVVAVFSNGADAIEYIKTAKVDLIITDIMMPGISGVEVARFVYEHFPHISVIVISGYADFSYAVEVMQYNVNYYLTKPVDLAKMREILAKFYERKKKSAEFDKQVSNGAFSINDVFNCCSKLIQYVVSADAEGITVTVDKLISVLPDEPTMLQKHILDLYELVEKGVEDFGIIINKALMDEEIKKQLGHLNTKEDFRKIFIAALSALMKIDSQQKENVENIIIRKAKKYIAGNYGSDISLDEVADYLGLSSTYFSRLFHRLVGETFIEYITDIRIEAAKKLLAEQRYKVYEISEMVGFSSSNYFRTLFKKRTGSTPNEYIQTVIKA